MKFISRNTDSAAEQRSNARNTLLLAAVMTPILLLPEPVRRVVSVEATLFAVGSGVLTGCLVSIASDYYRLDGKTDVRTTIGGLVVSAVGTALVWVLVPSDLVPTTLQFALAFSWSLALTAVARHVLRPSVFAPDLPRE